MTFEGKFIDNTARAARRGASVRVDALMWVMRLFESGWDGVSSEREASALTCANDKRMIILRKRG